MPSLQVDLTPWVKGHTSYLHHLREIQVQVDIDSYWPVGVFGLSEAASSAAASEEGSSSEATNAEVMAQAGNLTL